MAKGAVQVEGVIHPNMGQLTIYVNGIIGRAFFPEILLSFTYCGNKLVQGTFYQYGLSCASLNVARLHTGVRVKYGARRGTVSTFHRSEQLVGNLSNLTLRRTFLPERLNRGHK